MLDADITAAELRDNAKLTAHSRDDSIEGAQIHIRAALDFCYCGLADSECPCEFLLGHLKRPAQLCQVHLLRQELSFYGGALLCFRRHFAAKFREWMVTCHGFAPVIRNLNLPCHTGN